MCITCVSMAFGGVLERFLARFSFSVFLSIYNSLGVIYIESNTEKLNLAKIALKRLQTPRLDLMFEIKDGCTMPGVVNR